jgi:RNA polymerase-binding transcription factor DksA
MVDSQTLEEFRERLVERRRQILIQLENYAEALASLEQSRPPELSEEAQEVAAANSLTGPGSKGTAGIGRDCKGPLEKIDLGTYGVCERCEKDIGLARLKGAAHGRAPASIARNGSRRGDRLSSRRSVVIPILNPLGPTTVVGKRAPSAFYSGQVEGQYTGQGAIADDSLGGGAEQHVLDAR